MDKNNTKIRWSIILPVVLVSVLALAIFVGSVMEYNSLRKERANLQREIELLNQKIERYEHDLNAVMNDEYIESVAKDKLGLVSPDEIIINSDLND